MVVAVLASEASPSSSCEAGRILNEKLREAGRPAV